jgi:DNA-binding LytR/AlgR family response regulator
MIKLRTIIIDDDTLSLKAMEHLCNKFETLELVRIFDKPKEALDFLTGDLVDLIFLDIQMPEINGLDLLDRISVMPQVIFITGHKDYAFEAFEYDVTDFLQKPVSFNRLAQAVRKAEYRAEKLEKVTQGSLQTELYVRIDGKLIRVPIDQILYFENVGDFVKIVTESKVYVINMALRLLNERLDHPRLLKVHRSYIVNMDKINDIEENSILVHKKIIPVSRSHKPILMKSINIIN